MDAVEKELLDGEFNMSITENGAVGYKTTGKNLLDLNFQVSSLRKETPEEIASKFQDAFLDNKLYALKWLFYLRDVRGGLGERRSFRIIMNYLADTEPEITEKIINLIPEYGRYDDLLCLFGTKCEGTTLSVIRHQFFKDIESFKDDKPVSLLAKWLPSCNASSKETKRNAHIIREYLEFSEKTYRKVLSVLRKHIDVVERKMSAREWNEIKYEAVPSRANLIYNNAFLRNDADRRKEYLQKLAKGETKINASILFPHDIVAKYRTAGGSFYRMRNIRTDETLEALWKALPNLVQGNSSTLVIRDGSGSMNCNIDYNSQVTALDVSTALAIYFAERASGEFKDKYITFGNKPKIVNLQSMTTLRDKVIRSYNEADCSNTNIKATFDLILNVAVNNNMKQEDMPKNILIVSDMEFDGAIDYEFSRYNSRDYKNQKKALFKQIEENFRVYGYKMPRLVFWNVCSRTKTIPVRENELGVALVSGFSVNVINMVLSGELDPYKCLIEQLDSERYKAVEDALQYDFELFKDSNFQIEMEKK